MDLLHRLYNAIMADRNRKWRKLEKLLREAMPYYDSEYELNWTMDKLIAKILEITDGKK